MVMQVACNTLKYNEKNKQKNKTNTNEIGLVKSKILRIKTFYTIWFIYDFVYG